MLREKLDKLWESWTFVFLFFNDNENNNKEEEEKDSNEKLIRKCLFEINRMIKFISCQILIIMIIIKLKKKLFHMKL